MLFHDLDHMHFITLWLLWQRLVILTSNHEHANFIRRRQKPHKIVDSPDNHMKMRFAQLISYCSLSDTTVTRLGAFAAEHLHVRNDFRMQFTF